MMRRKGQHLRGMCTNVSAEGKHAKHVDQRRSDRLSHSSWSGRWCAFEHPWPSTPRYLLRLRYARRPRYLVLRLHRFLPWRLDRSLLHGRMHRRTDLHLRRRLTRFAQRARQADEDPQGEIRRHDQGRTASRPEASYARSSCCESWEANIRSRISARGTTYLYACARREACSYCNGNGYNDHAHEQSGGSNACSATSKGCCTCSA